MTVTTRTDTARVAIPETDRAARRAPAYTAVTMGPGEEDWAVYDNRGVLLYVGPAILAARYAQYFGA